MPTEGPWGQAVPTRSLNQKPCHLGEFRFSNPKERPDPVFGPTNEKCRERGSRIRIKRAKIFSSRIEERNTSFLKTLLIAGDIAVLIIWLALRA